MSQYWTSEEEHELRSLHASGVPLLITTKALCRSYKATSIKAHKLGLMFVRPDRRKVNEHAFRHMTPDTAWLLGLLFADGCWGGAKTSVHLTSVDEDLVTQMRDILDSDYPIERRDPTTMAGCKGKRTQFRLCLNSRAMIDSLSDLGIPRLKSERAVFPPMDPDLLHHFIRGYWDGDGGVSAQGHAYVAGPILLMERLHRHLIGEGIIPGRIYHPKQCKSIATFHIMRRPELIKLHRYLYSDATRFCHRKREIWDRIISDTLQRVVVKKNA